MVVEKTTGFVRSDQGGGNRRGIRREDGYVLALVALLMLPMVAFTGFAVDLGSWYARAAKIQRASDAAALAGVQELPNLPRAVAVAKSVAEQNGFTDGVDGIAIAIKQVSVPGDPSAKLQVKITDPAVEQFFTKVLRGSDVGIERIGTGQAIRPVAMGSPKNYLGTGDLTNIEAGFKANFWLAISGGCASKENGDRIQAQTDANFSGVNNPNNPGSTNRWATCTGGNTVKNAEYDPNGYFYAVEFKEKVNGRVSIEVYDPGYCSGAAVGRPNDTGGKFTTTFQMRDNTSFDPLQSGKLGTAMVAGEDDNCHSWAPLYVIDNPTKGVYFVQVTSQVQSGSSQGQTGSNGFSLRARTGSSWTPCSSDPAESSAAAPYLSGCPQVYGYSDLGVLANLEGTAAQFYLAQLGPDYNNKKMELALFDPGEGSRALQILDPNNNPVAFEWEVSCADGSVSPCSDGTVAPTGGWSGTSGTVTFGSTTVSRAIDLWGAESNSRDVCGDTRPCAYNPQPGPRRLSTSKYSDRLVRLTVQLPPDINAAFGGKQWYKIKYYVGTAPTDRTTWSVSVKGAPVRLIPNP